MHTTTFFPKLPPSLDEVKAFVESQPEGAWVEASGNARGVIEAADGRVYVDYDDHFREYFDRYLDEQQRLALIARLGFLPTLALHIHTSHAYSHSRELARAIGEQFLHLWGGGWEDEP